MSIDDSDFGNKVRSSRWWESNFIVVPIIIMAIVLYIWGGWSLLRFLYIIGVPGVFSWTSIVIIGVCMISLIVGWLIVLRNKTDVCSVYKSKNNEDDLYTKYDFEKEIQQRMKDLKFVIDEKTGEIRIDK